MLSVRILLVDDNPEFLASLRRFLADRPGIAVVGVALSGPEAIEQSARLQPDLVLLDLVMPGMNGLEVLPTLKEQSDSPKVILLTLHSEVEFRSAGEKEGADGFVTKKEMGKHLLAQINILFPGVAQRQLEPNSEPSA